MPYKDPEVKKAKHAEYSRKHYEGNYARRREEINTRRRRLKTEWDNFKKTLKCVKCGFTPEHHTQLDVDHIDGNHGNNDPVNLQTLCKNCHSLKTHAPELFEVDPTAG